MTTIYETESGSLYEVDVENRRVRRLEAGEKLGPRNEPSLERSHLPTGEWRAFVSMGHPETYRRLVIVFRPEDCLCEPRCSSPGTITSMIVAKREAV